ncbi:MAG: hypothetical protein GX786_10025, partial [Clostridiales bacterium]|nr:hypothetical protein [Clostridiales bacterium]
MPMHAETKKSLLHTLIAFLFAVGISLPLSFALSFQAFWPIVLLISFLIPSLFLLLSGNKKISLTLLILFVFSQLISAFALPQGGPILSSFTSCLKALILFIKGQRSALPLYGFEFTFWLSVIVALFAFLLTKEGNGFFPALSLLLFSLLALWFIGKSSLLVFSLPSVIATISLYVRQTNDDINLWKTLPIIIIISLLAFFILPTSKMKIAPLEEQANKVRDFITDHLFFTKTRTVFSLDKEGYFMGGPPEPSEQLIMKVTTPEKTYLRGSIKNEYTGFSWIDTTGGQRHLFSSIRWNSLKENLFDQNRPDQVMVSQHTWLDHSFPVIIDMISSSPSTLFIAQRFHTLQASEGLTPYFNNGSEIFITRDLYTQDRYAFNAKAYTSARSELTSVVNALATSSDPSYDKLFSLYTLLPDHMEDSLYKLANEITAPYTTAYEKALALESYLQQYYAYTLSPEPVPANRDFVSYFIHNGKEGYCTYFASAMTVFARMVGLPARYVEGYVATPNQEQVAYVTGENAHAWTEIYFPNFGWVTFDATPGEQEPNAPPPPSNDPPTTGADEEPDPSPSPNPDEEDVDPDVTDPPQKEEQDDPTPT